MKAEKAVIYRLKNYNGVTTLVGQRVYNVFLPQDPTYPLILVKRVSSNRVKGVWTDPGYAYSTLQVTSFASGVDGALALNEQVRLALQRYAGTPTGTAVNGVTVYDITMGSETEPVYLPELEAVAIACDYTVMHAE